MDSVDLFRKLGAGAKFNLKRFGKDAEHFKVVRTTSSNSAVSQLLSGIHYFGADQSHAVPSDSGAEREASEEEDGEEEMERGVKRKQVEERSGRKRKKKERGGPSQEVTEGDGIRWTSCLERKTKSLQQDGKEKSLKRLKQLHQEQVNSIRAKHRIHVHGYDVPDPLCTFEELQSEYRLNPRVLQNLRDAGLSKPTPIQMQAMPLMMHGREVLACAPTGSGKTMAFCLPLLAQLQQPTNQGLRALILAPTRELASQTYRELLRLSEGVGFRVQIIDKASIAAKKYGPQSYKKWDILVTTPNRLIYLLQEEPPALDLGSVEWLVVDESDKLFEVGKKRTGFREQLAVVFQACSSPRVRRAFFSATCSPPVEQWCRLNLDNLVTVNIGRRNVAVETVDQELLFVGKEYGKLLAVRDIISKGFLPPMLVFVQSIERARELFHELVYEGINVDVIHAQRTQQQRDNVVASFRSGKIWVLICTALMARGMDFKGVNLVLNYDFPTSAVEYIHRIGRTGRAGHSGKAITFFTEDDKPLLRSIANVMKQAGCPVPDYMIGLKKIHSKVKQWLQKRPPRRSSIMTTPRCLLKTRPRQPQRPTQERPAQDEQVQEKPAHDKAMQERPAQEKPAQKDGGGGGKGAEKKKKGKKGERKSEGMSCQADRRKKQHKSRTMVSKSSPLPGKKRKNRKDRSQAS